MDSPLARAPSPSFIVRASPAEDNDLALCLHFLPFIFQRAETYCQVWRAFVPLHAASRIIGTYLRLMKELLGRRKRGGGRGRDSEDDNETSSRDVVSVVRRVFEKSHETRILLFPHGATRLYRFTAPRRVFGNEDVLCKSPIIVTVARTVRERVSLSHVSHSRRALGVKLRRKTSSIRRTSPYNSSVNLPFPSWCRRNTLRRVALSS